VNLKLGYLLKTLRLSAGISLRELARIIDVSPTYLSLVENEKVPPPSAARVAKIEEALKVPPGCLVGIIHGFRSDVMSFIEKVPEAANFLNVAKENLMTPADFMELTGFLNAYGWEKLKQALEVTVPQRAKSVTDSGDGEASGPYVWPFLDEKLIFDVTDAKEKASFLEEAVNRVSTQCDDIGPSAVLKELLRREKIASTGIGHGIAVPHAYVDGLARMIVALLRIPKGLHFAAIDEEPVHIVFLMAGPRASKNLHLQLLARTLKLLSHRNFFESVLQASGPREIISLFKAAEAQIP
jgi:PTS system nitrogen regulatory IIA component